MDSKIIATSISDIKFLFLFHFQTAFSSLVMIFGQLFVVSTILSNIISSIANRDAQRVQEAKQIQQLKVGKQLIVRSKVLKKALKIFRLKGLKYMNPDYF